jgi:hypothetical protein
MRPPTSVDGLTAGVLRTPFANAGRFQSTVKGDQVMTYVIATMVLGPFVALLLGGTLAVRSIVRSLTEK